MRYGERISYGGTLGAQSIKAGWPLKQGQSFRERRHGSGHSRNQCCSRRLTEVNRNTPQLINRDAKIIVTLFLGVADSHLPEQPTLTVFNEGGGAVKRRIRKMEGQIETPCIIGIDCPPGEPRPDFFFPKVLRRSGLRVSDFVLKSKFYGAWTWEIKSSPEKCEIFLRQRSLFRSRLVALVQKAVVRGAVIEPKSSEPG